MMRNGLSVAMLALLSFGTAGASAQGCDPLVESMQIAAETAPEVSVAQARVQRAEADLAEARSLRRPQLSTFGRSGVGDTGLTTNQNDNQVGLRLSQRVFDFGDARLAIDSAEYQRERLAFDQASAEAQAAYALGSAYLAAQEARGRMAVIAERRDYYARQLESVDALLVRGGATRAERAQIAAQLAEADAVMLELRSQEERAGARLEAYLGRPAGVCEEAQTAAELADRLADLQTADQALDAVMAANPRMDATRSNIRSLEAQRQRQRRSRLPVVDVVGISSYTYDDAREDWDYRDRIGVDVSVPILTGNALGARSDRADAVLEEQEYALRQLQRDLREQGGVVFRRLLSLRAQQVQREAVAASQREYFEAIAGEFEFGLGTLPDLVEARLDYERAMLDLVAVEFELKRQQLDLMLLTSRLP